MENLDKSNDPSSEEKVPGCCPTCGAPPKEHVLKNYSQMWHEGDVYCTRCGAYVRMYDAG
jgi:hypothetical protein